jgi:hypothetical protein
MPGELRRVGFVKGEKMSAAKFQAHALRLKLKGEISITAVSRFQIFVLPFRYTQMTAVSVALTAVICVYIYFTFLRRIS